MAWPTDSARSKNWGTEILTDADLEAQLDLLHTYFKDSLNGTTGHGHTGGTNDGKQINLATSANITSQAQGDIIYASSSTVFARLGAGTAGQALTTGGAAANPSWSGLTTQGDVEYHNGTTRTRLAAGTSGQVLTTGGAGANPSWGNIIAGVKDYGSSASSSTAKTLPLSYICYGSVSITNNSSQAITNLPFTSSSSYSLTVTPATSATTITNHPTCVLNSGSQATIYNNDGTTRTMNWIAIGT